MKNKDKPFQSFEDAVYAVPILYEALQEVINVLGPNASCSIAHCVGCKGKVAALDAAYKAFLKLGLKHQYDNHPDFKIIKKRILKKIKK